MANFLQSLAQAFSGRRSVSPYDEAGAPGTAIFGGYVENIEKDPRLQGHQRYVTVSEMLANVSIVAASVRYFLNLVSAPSWNVEPAKDMPDGQASDAAKKAAEYMDEVINDMGTSWRRVVRRSGQFRFHGFGIHEWTAKRRDDGMIGLLDIEPRPAHTIEKWDRDLGGTILGVSQRNPQDGSLLYIPRSKFVYLVDDALSDSPEGLGIYRQLIEPSEQLKDYLRLEGMGYERDLRGIPVGYAPLSELNDLLFKGRITKEEHRRRLAGMKNFLKAEAKAKNTSLLLDSASYLGTTQDGTQVSATPKWKTELLSSSGGSHEFLGAAITRLEQSIARIIGTEALMMGGSGSGNRALSEDKSRNLYLAVNAAVDDLGEAYQRDAVEAVWSLNGFPPELKPKLKPEDVAFKDAAGVAATLRDMATAGAVLSPDDPAIDDVRDLLGINRRPDDAIARELEMDELNRQAREKALTAPAPGAPPKA